MIVGKSPDKRVMGSIPVDMKEILQHESALPEFKVKSCLAFKNAKPSFSRISEK